jgi:gamma-glutamyltranspeptidase/glutathione hydrolase
MAIKEELIDLDKSGTYQVAQVIQGPYMTVVDKEGNMVSNSAATGDGFWNGSSQIGLYVTKDRGELFDLEEGKPNSLRQKMSFMQLYLPQRSNPYEF